MSTQTRLSLGEFLALPDIDERRLELIDGDVYEKMSPRWGQSRLALKLGRLFDDIGYAGVESRAIIPPGGDLGPSSPVPDVAFYRDDPPGDDEWMTTPPDVAVELLSLGQSRAAMRTKVAAYRAFGVPSIWVVDLERKNVDIYEGGARRTLAGADLIASEHAPGFSISVNELFARPTKRV
jgi:Uma2 family endonuclease